MTMLPTSLLQEGSPDSRRPAIRMEWGLEQVSSVSEGRSDSDASVDLTLPRHHTRWSHTD